MTQIYQIGKDIGERISNVVVMGTGEPLDNYDNLLRFIELLTDENGINISQRNLTVSTCGLVPRMRQLADEKLSITLALSLHASNQEKRKALMPVANSYDIHDVVDACKYYFAQTGRRVTFEYSLVGGVNDTAEDATELSALVHGMNCHINLIPVNPIKEAPGNASRRYLANPYEISPVSFFTLAFKPYWLRCASSTMTTTLRRDVSTGYSSPFPGEDF